MISGQCDIKEFVNAVKGHDYAEMISLAAHEATLAERCRYRRKKCSAEARECLQYSNQLKNLIFYLRCSTKPSGKTLPSLNLFRELLDTESEMKYRTTLRSAGRSVFYLPVRSSRL